jgi:hypothetical protein
MPDPTPKPQTPPVYKKLPGKGTSFLERITLYLAPDHLLYVSSTGFSESYRRFYYRDIHSVTVRKTATGPLFNALCGTLLFLCLVGALSTGGAMGWIGWGIPAALCVTLLLINVLRGPTCVCDIHTAVQSRQLYSVNRLRRAARFLAVLRPLLLAAQGELTLDELRIRVDTARQSAFANAAPPVIGQTFR